MDRIIDAASSVAPYEQLRRHIAARIDSGELEARSRLPTVRELARLTGLATNTAARAYRELESAGYIRTEGRRGTFVADRARPGHGVDPERADRTPEEYCLESEMALLRRETYLGTALVDGWLAADFAMVDREGRLLDRDAAVAALQRQAHDHRGVEDLHADRLGPSVVLLDYVTLGPAMGCRTSSVWVGGVSGWQCRFRQSTPLAH